MQAERTGRDLGRLPRLIAEALVQRQPAHEVSDRVRTLGVSEQVAVVLARLGGAVPTAELALGESASTAIAD